MKYFLAKEDFHECLCLYLKQITCCGLLKIEKPKDLKKVYEHVLLYTTQLENLDLKKIWFT